jgi:hypothetical protein
MRQHRWLEVLKNYDSKMFYLPAKANVVADALSRKSCGGETDPDELIEQMSQQFAIVQIDEVMTGGSCSSTTMYGQNQISPRE